MKYCVVELLALVLVSFLLMGALARADEPNPDDAISIPGVSVHERVLNVPIDSPQPATLVVTIMTPDGNGPFPLAVMNHGSNADQKPSEASRYHNTFAAYYFLSRGYAVVLPMMRGYAGSTGHPGKHGCDLAGLGLNNAEDIKAVIEYIARDPTIDSTRIVIAGQSYGGWNTLAFGAHDFFSNVRGLINFVGGVISSACHDTQNALVTAAGTFGSKTRLPSIWFYGDNDSLFPPSIWRGMYDQYTAAGGKAELVAFGAFNLDAHQFLGFPESLPIWTPRVDAFLEQIGMPNALVHPEYLPKPFPLPSNFAAIDDINAVPYINDQGRALYQVFLSKPMSRVFVISTDGSASAQYGGFDPLGQAILSCQVGGHVCYPYAIDSYVVWTPLKVSVPLPSHYAAIDDLDSVPYINDQGRALYTRFLSYAGSRALVLSPTGSVYARYGGDEAYTVALENCRKESKTCEPYAINNDVVWTHPTPVPPATSYAVINDYRKIPYVRAEGQVGYVKFLNLRKPRAFVVAPDGAWSLSSRGADPVLAALSNCAKRHQNCRLYAVDDQVVW